MKSTPPSAADVSAELAKRIESLCADLLGAGKRNGAYWTIGGIDNSPGASMWVHLHGAKQGNWQDGATGEFGDALDLLAVCRYAGDKKAAYAAGRAWLGWGDSTPTPTRAPPPAARAPTNDDDTARKRAYALRLYLEARPSLTLSPVASYLADRGIDIAALGRQPRALRYHPDLKHRESGLYFPAMVAAISGPDGTHIATHRTYLERTGGGWIRLRHAKKMALGDFAQGSIRIWRGASKRPLRDAPHGEPVVIGEGIETCLSIALACPELRILCGVSLGNMGGVWLPDQVRMVILAADNDTHPAARLGLQRAIERHIDAGREVRIARAQEGNDFNDMLRGAA